MAELFGVTQQNISYHLSQIEESGELHLSDAYKKNLLPSDKWSGEVMMYNLDVVIAVGYRVNSYEATQFRIWATQVLKEYLTKGFVLDDERLKGKNVFGADYFDDLLDRIREIRIRERRYYSLIQLPIQVPVQVQSKYNHFRIMSKATVKKTLMSMPV